MGSGERREKEKEIRRNDIIEAAEAVFFAKGYNQATMDDVAKAAEFSKRTLYVYFSSKEQIYFEIMTRGYRLMLEMLRQDIRENPAANALGSIRQMGDVFYRFSKEHPEYFEAMIQYETAEDDFIAEAADKTREECYALGEEITEHLIGMLWRGMDEGVIRKELNVVHTALMLWSSVVGVLNTALKKENYLRHMHGTTPDELVAAAFSLMVESISV
ncbi:TetR/AcrR family transcriptional regulator [Paenibacillus sp. HW567]|uniref:TetR/AcrR family transcriptional regulator n=1 Tax=Paenibacillus sp. HW567 TaxID=1034769 RepID=UPI00036246CE|nr:TetR/AcrR family transcriptional regulator [Paenibacillus sp. HW567]